MNRQIVAYVQNDKRHHLDIYQSQESLLKTLKEIFKIGYGYIYVLEVKDKPIPTLNMVIPRFYSDQTRNEFIENWVKRLPSLLYDYCRLEKDRVKNEIESLSELEKEMNYWTRKEPVVKAVNNPFKLPNLIV